MCLLTQPLLAHRQRSAFESPVRSPSAPTQWERVEGLTKVDAEDLLDWLEAHGHSQAHVFWREKQGFAVYWSSPYPVPRCPKH
jgi:hypothetical protein